ncbi:MAG: type IV pilus modification protein PilV [Gammaproteobacteria bacterium]|nr:type IV pilus modification protein PilV [Gammaproteobacteria bacterium]NNC97053.1 type IV pilus modification protein PilV [Gammaproteobacteria bacterium]NNM14351.1 type IV pilus modification protein PilV [Gammaproteobacteria bacterium]
MLYESTQFTSKDQGFTLIEILIALLIISVGLLGLARLQLVGIKNTQSGYLRSQVSFLGNDIMERIQQNPDSAKSNAYDIALTADPATTDCIGDAAKCSTTDMANFDLRIWKGYLANLLPSGNGSISSAAGADETIFTITIQWFDEYQSEATTQSATFTMSLP